MAKTRMTSRDFNQDIGSAKKAAASGPVVITNRGTPTHVLLSFDEYSRLTHGSANIVDLIKDTRAARVELELGRVETSSLKVPELPK